MNNPDLSIIIVSWNAKDYLLGCLRSIEQTCQDLNYEVFVIDNASSDGSPEAVRENFPDVILIETGDNLGFAKANNIGIKESRGRYYCFVNSDVEVKPGCFQRLLAYMDSHSDVGLAGPRQLNGDGTHQISCRIPATLGSHLRRALFINTGSADPSHKSECTREVGSLAGSFWIARREAVEEVGCLDEAFFFYGEDIDWCRRFWQAGWKVCFHPEAVAIHYGGGSSAADPFRFNTELQRAILQYWEKYNSRASTVAYLLIGMLYHALRLVLRTFRLFLPIGQRQATITKWKQHAFSFKWLAQALAKRLVGGLDPARKICPTN